MEQVFIIMLIALGILAIIDITVGVSNDAANFLNSALGSKAVTFKTALIVAALGILVGALSSNGMMEIARSGIYNPSMFSFNEVMIIFFSVMVADILLLDLFNSLGLPTSTTVSIVFELLGAAVCMAIIKIVAIDGSLLSVVDYINTEKASEIVVSILLSVLLSFVLGMMVQYVARLFFTFQNERRILKYGPFFGGFAISFITFFILVKGLKGISFIDDSVKTFISEHQLLILCASFVLWTLVSYFVIHVLKRNVFQLIIIIGTFGLALAFAGNDLVNFIGVPIAAVQSYEFFSAASGADPKTYMMGELASNEIVAPFYYLAIAGVVMVITLWTSSKAKTVIETELNLARENEGEEKFRANRLAKIIVRGGVLIGDAVSFIIPQAVQDRIDKRFEKVEVKKSKKERMEAPAFDMIRASVNLMIASILIALGTSLKLPLSTTYVTFMVAMGTSFADRAWDRDTAVFRVSGVFNVIGGWFVTAFGAFISAAIVASLLYFGEIYAFVGILVVLGISLVRSNKKHKQKQKEKLEKAKALTKADIGTIQEVMSESSAQIAQVVARSSDLYTQLIDSLLLQDLNELKLNKRAVKKAEKDIDVLKSNVYSFIKNLDDTSVEASKFYIKSLGYLQDVVASLQFISQEATAHVDNNHKKLKFNQAKALKEINQGVLDHFNQAHQVFVYNEFESIDQVTNQVHDLVQQIDRSIQKQIERIRTSETSPKNSKLYFSILLETNNMVASLIKLLSLFKEFDAYVKQKK